MKEHSRHGVPPIYARRSHLEVSAYVLNYQFIIGTGDSLIESLYSFGLETWSLQTQSS
jgi:hypothetical protein